MINKVNDSRQIRDNKYFEAVYQILMNRFQENADKSQLHENEVRLEAAVARRTLRTFRELLLEPSKPTDI